MDREVNNNNNYRPESVAAAFFSNLFANPFILQGVLRTWRVQCQRLMSLSRDPTRPVGSGDTFGGSGSAGSKKKKKKKKKLKKKKTTTQRREDAEDDDDDNDDDNDEMRDDTNEWTSLWHFFTSAQLLDVELLAQENAIPTPQEKAARTFIMVRFLFVIPMRDEPQGLVLDDAFMAYLPELEWPEGLRPHEFCTCLAHLCARSHEFWEHSENEGMLGHVRYSRFKFARAPPCLSIVQRPSIILSLAAYSLLMDAAAHAFYTHKGNHEDDDDDALIAAVDQDMLGCIRQLALGMTQTAAQLDSDRQWVVHHPQATPEARPTMRWRGPWGRRAAAIGTGTVDREALASLYWIFVTCQTAAQVPHLWQQVLQHLHEHVFAVCRFMTREIRRDAIGHILPAAGGGGHAEGGMSETRPWIDPERLHRMLTEQGE